ncbi:glycosyltransferase family 2 protein [Geobacter sulfurreducens]|uniref:glycosyltransferase family 2 protein n=1 Tax=Geobacter sulfurreducens TaxID=35554 RepID=UPI000DBB9922|nr:glycosyltransferase family 2 protein [Geobacter sulfurreducens]BBA70698.1 SPBc2 prophage-derived glycosyltransferase SunS [Geobacter sulfurreducens]
MAKVSVYIIAYNEEQKIEPALQSVTWADEIVVVDSFSTDRTAEIARKYTDKVIQVPFEGFGKLRNSAIAATSHEWIFSLDTDERCTEEAKNEILAIIDSPDALDAYYVPRRNIFMGRWVKHSGWYPDYRQPQLFRRGAQVFTDEVVHESFTTIGRVGHMKNAIWQIPFRNFEQMISKIDRYSTLGAAKMTAKGVRPGMGKALFHALFAFFRMYILRLGILDGWAGFVIALYTFEGTFYRYAKQVEAARGWIMTRPEELER